MSLGKVQDASDLSNEGGKKEGNNWDKSNGTRCYNNGKAIHFMKTVLR